MLFMVLMRATGLVIAGYFVLFASSKTDDVRIRNFGKYLAVWTFIFAVLFALGTVTTVVSFTVPAMAPVVCAHPIRGAADSASSASNNAVPVILMDAPSRG